MIISMDFETRSRADLRRVGPRKYAEAAEVLCMAYAVDEGPVQLWTPGDPYPMDFLYATEFRAWNAGFERAIWARTCERLYGWPVCPRPERWVDTQARALLAGLPAALGLAALALGLPVDEQKDKAGKQLIRQLCIPRKDGSFNEDPLLLEQMYAYCEQDVRTERAIAKGLPPLPVFEHRVWAMTEEINEAGLPVDEAGITGAVGYADRALAALNKVASRTAGGDFDTVSQLAKVHAWLEARGFPLPDLKATTVDAALENEGIPEDVATVLAARRGAGLSSIKKFHAALERLDAAGRVCDTLRYHGASTGRWTGAGIQPQNIKRPKLTPEEADRWLCHLADKGTIPGVPYLRGITLLGDCARGMIQADPGYVLVASDYSQIELRALLWLAMDEPNLQEIRDGLDPYRTMASSIFSTPYSEVTKGERQAGKVAVLGCGYQSGVKGMQKFAAGYGLELDDPEAQLIVDTYRGKHPRVVAFWYDLDAAVRTAISNPGHTYRARRLFVRVKKNRRWLEIMLPSGRPLRYYRPRMELVKRPWGDKEPGICFDGMDSYTRRWGRQSTYGGKLVENATQGLARDIMATGMLNARAAGMNLIMTVHDEIVCHEPDLRSNEEFLAKINAALLRLPAWAKGLPLAAEGWVGNRYRK